MMSTASLITHEARPMSLEESVLRIQKRIERVGNKPHVTVAKQLDILEQLQAFDFGRFLIQNEGVDGYWTHYMLTYPRLGRKTGRNNRGELLTELEHFILDCSPLMLATQARFDIFLEENQTMVHEGASLACIPSGLMAELFYLDYRGVDKVKLVGIDLDEQSLRGARALAEEKRFTSCIHLYQQDAWALDEHEAFDLITSNGLTIYEPDAHRIGSLYQTFYRALKPHGKLVTSFLTYPPGFHALCEWNISAIKMDDLLLQRIIFSDVLDSKFRCFTSTEETRAQLELAGFTDIRFIYDKAHVFPTVTAIKN
jgi:SAM-dependent methyltransferase